MQPPKVAGKTPQVERQASVPDMFTRRPTHTYGISLANSSKQPSFCGLAGP